MKKPLGLAQGLAFLDVPGTEFPLPRFSVPEAGINVFGLLRQVADLSADFLLYLRVPLSDFELAVIFIDVGGCISVCAFAAFVVLLFFWRLLKIFSPLVLLIVVIALTVILWEKLFARFSMV